MIEELNHNNLFVCTVCDRLFLSFAELKSYFRTHGKQNFTNHSVYISEQPFQSNVCQKVYKSKA